MDDFSSLSKENSQDRIHPEETICLPSQAMVLGRPWIRFFARSLDFSLLTILVNGFFLFFLRINVGRDSLLIDFLTTLAFLFLLFCFEPLLLHLWGTTPGKWIFGLRITTPKGEKICYNRAFFRTWNMLFYGLGLCIPILKLFRCYKSYQALNSGKTLPWDENISYNCCKNIGIKRGLLFSLVFFLICNLNGLLFLQGEMPRHQGKLTTEEFVENVNDLMKFYQWNQGWQLQNNGIWIKTEENEIPFYDPIYPPLSFHIREEEGEVREIHLSLTYKGPVINLSYFLEEMTAASYSFIFAQDSFSLFSSQKKALLDALKAFPGHSFSLEVAGIKVDCIVENQGFFDSGTFLFAKEEEGFYHVNFTLQKLK